MNMLNDIPNIDHIICYCSPNTFRNNRIISTAFDIRDNEEFVSVNWISNKIDIRAGLEQTKSILLKKEFRLKQNGRFVVFNVGIIKSYIHKSIGIKISIRHVFSSGNPTHAGIFLTNVDNPYKRQIDMYEVSRILSAFTSRNPNSIYPVFGTKK